MSSMDCFTQAPVCRPIGGDGNGHRLSGHGAAPRAVVSEGRVHLGNHPIRRVWSAKAVVAIATGAYKVALLMFASILSMFLGAIWFVDAVVFAGFALEEAAQIVGGAIVVGVGSSWRGLKTGRTTSPALRYRLAAPAYAARGPFRGMMPPRLAWARPPWACRVLGFLAGLLV